MILRPLAACVFVALVMRLIRELQPSRYGIILGCFLLYLPLSGKFQLNLAPGINLVTIFFVTLLMQKKEEGEVVPGGEHEGAVRGLLMAWIAICAWGFLLALSGQIPVAELVVLLKRWLDPIFACLLAFRITKQEDRKFVLACVLLGYLLVGAQGLRHGLDYGDKVRIGGLFDQPNDLGAFLAMYAPLALVTAVFMTTGWIRYALLGGVGVSSWALLYTQSRAALLALPLGVLTVLFRSGRQGLGFLGVLLVMLFWWFPEVLPEQATARFESTYVEDNALPGSSGQLEDSAASRMDIWTGALNMIAENPLGVGFAQFQLMIEKYVKFRNEARDAHNFYLLVCAELGVLGLLLLLGLVWKILTVSWAVSQRSEDEFVKWLGLGVFATVLVTIMVNVFGSRMMTLQVATSFWVLAAITVRAYDCQLAAEQAHTRAAIRGRLRGPLARAEN
ncbi:MAG: O-antigen ligase family protein [Candidatus Binatia bacterium]